MVWEKAPLGLKWLLNSEKKPIALTVVELCLTEGIRQWVSQRIYEDKILDRC